MCVVCLFDCFIWKLPSSVTSSILSYSLVITSIKNSEQHLQLGFQSFALIVSSSQGNMIHYLINWTATMCYEVLLSYLPLTNISVCTHGQRHDKIVTRKRLGPRWVRPGQCGNRFLWGLEKGISDIVAKEEFKPQWQDFLEPPCKVSCAPQGTSLAGLAAEASWPCEICTQVHHTCGLIHD